MPSAFVKRKREVTTIWSALLFMSSLKLPNGAAALAMASARWSRKRELELWTTSDSTMRPRASIVRLTVSSPYSLWPLSVGKLAVPLSSIRWRSLS